MKATSYADEPWLKVRVEKATPGRYYVLVVVYRTQRAARYIGYADYNTLVKNGIERLPLKASKSKNTPAGSGTNAAGLRHTSFDPG